MDRETFRIELETALANVRDVVALRTMALCDLVAVDVPRKEQSWELARYLLDSIEQLRPESEEDCDSWPRRRFDVLALRYVSGLSPDEVAERMGVSRRHFYRQLQRALDELAEYLWPDVAGASNAAHADVDPGTDEDATDPQHLLRQESSRVASLQQGSSLDEVLHSVLQVLAPLLAERHVDLCYDSAADLPTVSASSVVLKQLLLGLLGEILRSDRVRAIDITTGILDGNVCLMVIGRSAPGAPMDQKASPAGAAVEPNYIDLASFQGVRIERLKLGAGEDGYAVVLAPEVDRSVLVVDDNEDVCLLFRRYLLSAGYRPFEVTSGEEAIAFARKHPLYAITLDLMMSNEDGWDVLQALNHDPRTAGIPIVVCSVLDQEQLALMLGATAFLKKPVRREQLLQSLAQLRAPLVSPR